MEVEEYVDTIIQGLIIAVPFAAGFYFSFLHMEGLFGFVHFLEHLIPFASERVSEVIFVITSAFLFVSSLFLIPGAVSYILLTLYGNTSTHDKSIDR